VSGDVFIYKGTEAQLIAEAENMIENAACNSAGAYKMKCGRSILSHIQS